MSLTKNYYRNAEGVILVFDINEPDSFYNMEKTWLKSIEDDYPNIPKVIIANKADLQKLVTNTEIKKFEEKHKLVVYESSAKQGEGITEPFNHIIDAIMKNKNKKQIKNDNEKKFNIDKVDKDSDDKTKSKSGGCC